MVAVTRNKNSAKLNELIAGSNSRAHNVVIEDVADEKSIQAALPAIREILPNGLDVLINNAGTSALDPDGWMESVTVESMVTVYRTNVGGVQAVTAGLLPLLKQGHGKKIINM